MTPPHTHTHTLTLEKCLITHCPKANFTVIIIFWYMIQGEAIEF